MQSGIGWETDPQGITLGGQYLFCVPEQQLVVVILSRFARARFASSRWTDRWNIVEGLLAER